MTWLEDVEREERNLYRIKVLEAALRDVLSYIPCACDLAPHTNACVRCGTQAILERRK